MDPNKMHERVLEIQKNISVATPEQQTAMLGELLEIASKVEQSLSEIKIDTDRDYNSDSNVIRTSITVVMELANAKYI